MLKKFIFILIILANSLFCLEKNIFLKSGIGLGYDSNLLFSSPYYPTELYLFKIEGLGKWGKENFKFVVNMNSDVEVYNVYYNFTGGVGAGILLLPTDETLIKLSTYYNYTSDINQSFSGKAEFKQDIFGFLTTGLSYNFENSMGLNGVTNQYYTLHNVSLSFDFDVTEFLGMELTFDEVYNSYSMIKIDGNNLQHNTISGDGVLVFKPSYNYNIKLGGGYAYHDAFNTNLLVFYDTNEIYLFNSANQYRIIASIDYEWNPKIKTSLSTEFSFSKLLYHQINENDYKVIFATDYFLNQNWKAEFTFLYNLKDSELLKNIERWRITVGINYLF
ncbi:MAG: hypothetical protein WHS77_07500 [Brevinematales bacterium]